MTLLDRLRRMLDHRFRSPNPAGGSGNSTLTVDTAPASSYLTSEHFYDLTEEPDDDVTKYDE